MSWEDVVKKNAEQLGSGFNWGNLALDREGWRFAAWL